MIPTRRLLALTLTSLVTATAIAACQTPAQQPAPVSAPAHGTARLVLKPEWSRQVQAAGGYTRADIHHVTLELFHVDGSAETAMSTLDVPGADLGTEIVFEGLAQGETYRVKAFAYKTPGDADLISVTDARSITEIAVAANATTTIATLALQLADRLALHGYVTTVALPLEYYDMPMGLAVDSQDNAYLVDRGLDRILKVTPGGQTTAYMAGAYGAYNFTDVASAPDGTLYASGSNWNIYKIPSGGGQCQVIGTTPNPIRAIDVAPSGQVYVASSHQILKVAPTGTVTPFAGNATEFGTQDGTGGAARFKSPNALGFDAQSNIYVADTGSGAVRRITPAGEVTTVATGLSDVRDVAAGADGTLYVLETAADRVRQLSPTGPISLLAGGTHGDWDGFGAGAKFNNATNLELDSQGRVLVIDTGKADLRKIY